MAALYVVFIAIALLAAMGLVVDGGYLIAARREAEGRAEQAARIGADALDTGALRSGVTAVNEGEGRAAAKRYLAAVDASGSVVVRGATVSVTVTVTQRMAVLSAIGVDSRRVSGTASATSITARDQPK